MPRSSPDRYISWHLRQVVLIMHALETGAVETAVSIEAFLLKKCICAICAWKKKCKNELTRLGILYQIDHFNYFHTQTVKVFEPTTSRTTCFVLNWEHHMRLKKLLKTLFESTHLIRVLVGLVTSYVGPTYSVAREDYTLKVFYGPKIKKHLEEAKLLEKKQKVAERRRMYDGWLK